MKRLHRYRLYWAPTGSVIGEVIAPNSKAACRLAPYPWREFLGEIYAEISEISPLEPLRVT